MSRYEIVNEFRKMFIEQNPSVKKTSLVPTFFSINSENVKASSNQFAFENAERGLVIYTYSYTVITQVDYCLVPLFFDIDGEAEDYIIVDGWKLSFSTPVTASRRCEGVSCYFSKGNLKGKIYDSVNGLVDNFERIWKLFSIVRTCVTQKELDYVCKIYKLEKDINELKEKNLLCEADRDMKNTIISAYQSLLDKIGEIVNQNNNNDIEQNVQ